MADKRFMIIAGVELILLIFIWSYNWIVMKNVLNYIGPFQFAALRALFGAILLFLILAASGRKLSPPPIIPTIFIGTMQIAGMTGMSQMALLTGGAGNTAVIVYTMPFWTIILAALFLNEKITPAKSVALVIALIGLLLIIRPWQEGMGIVSALFAMGAGFLWAMGSIAIKLLYNKRKIDLLNLAAWQMLVGAVILGAAAVTVNARPIEWSGYLIYALIYNALPATAIAWTLWMSILKALPASIAGLSVLLVPVVSVLLAWIILGERPETMETAGIMMILSALLIVSLPVQFIKNKLHNQHS